MIYLCRMKNFETVKNQLLNDPEIMSAYDSHELEYTVIKQIIRKRIEHGMTQKKLAEKVGTKQSAISRLESGKYNPSLLFLQKVAHALNSELSIQFS